MDKNQFGTLNEDGSIATWPDVDLNGREFERENATRASVDKTHFVVVPMNVTFDKALRDSLLEKLAPSVESFGRKKGVVDASS